MTAAQSFAQDINQLFRFRKEKRMPGGLELDIAFAVKQLDKIAKKV